jgi:hypothetical protein
MDENTQTKPTHCVATTKNQKTGQFVVTWLTNFNYRTVFPWWPFGVASTATLLITLFTVSYHTLHAANSKPSQSLRAEGVNKVDNR